MTSGNGFAAYSRLTTPVAPGSGSVSGSPVKWVVTITDVSPVISTVASNATLAEIATAAVIRHKQSAGYKHGPVLIDERLRTQWSSETVETRRPDLLEPLSGK
jgi:hypothetical protein